MPEMDQSGRFQTYLQWRLRSGWSSQEESGPIYDHAGRAVRDNSGGSERMAWRRPRLSRRKPPTSRQALRRSERIRERKRAA